MKYLIILLISFSALANVRVDISKNSKIANSALFDSQEIAESWVLDNEKILHGKRYRNSFGKIERWLKQDHGNSIDSRIITIPNPNGEDETYIEYKYKQTYFVEYKDDSIESGKRKVKKARKLFLRDELKTRDLKNSELNELMR